MKGYLKKLGRDMERNNYDLKTWLQQQRYVLGWVLEGVDLSIQI